jgi:hypothetical protein
VNYLQYCREHFPWANKALCLTLISTGENLEGRAQLTPAGVAAPAFLTVRGLNLFSGMIYFYLFK